MQTVGFTLHMSFHASLNVIAGNNLIGISAHSYNGYGSTFVSILHCSDMWGCAGEQA